MIYIRDDLKPLFVRERTVADFLKIEGKVFKAFPTRRTLKFGRGGQEFFIKSHLGFGWKEIIRKLASLHVPVVSARNEWRAIRALRAIGVDTMVIAGYGSEGISPASRRSFVMTEALQGTQSLERWAPDFVRRANSPAKLRLKHALIHKLADIAKRLHTNGLNHRDFYLCHFLLEVSDEERLTPDRIKLYLIDLHRTQIRKRTPRRWRVKDVAGLYFSAMDLALSASDCFRFVESYTGKTLRDALSEDRSFWTDVVLRAQRLYRRQHGRAPTIPRGMGGV